MKKNILLIIESSETGGAESIFLELACRLDTEQYMLHIALLYEGWLNDRLRAVGISPYVIPNRKGGFDIALLHGIGELIRHLRVDLVHSHLFTTNVYSSVSGVLAGIPVISTFHGTMDINSGDRLKKLKWLAINKFSKKIVFVSQYLQNYFVGQNLASRKKSQIIYNGIDINRFRRGPNRATARRELGLSADSFVIGCVGDLRPAKDYVSALRAVGILKKIIPDLKLIIAGSETVLRGELDAISKNCGILGEVQYLGFRSDIENVFPAFDVYLSSSVSEGFSLSVVEAMAAGIPVVATRSGGPEEIIQHGVSGLLVEIGSPEKIADALESIYRDKGTADALIKAGLNRVKTCFSVRAMVEGYHSLYSEIIAHRTQ